jgi:hypothetical protein
MRPGVVVWQGHETHPTRTLCPKLASLNQTIRDCVDPGDGGAAGVIASDCAIASRDGEGADLPLQR